MRQHKIELVDRRGQYRVDLRNMTDGEKCKLVHDLTNNTALWGTWRFTNKAIWVNKRTYDEDGFAEAIAMLLPSD